MARTKDRVYRVTLVFPLGDIRSVFIKAKTRERAEKRALRRHPKATQIDRSRNPLN